MIVSISKTCLPPHISCSLLKANTGKEPAMNYKSKEVKKNWQQKSKKK
jgi:hypothetical protein